MVKRCTRLAKPELTTEWNVACEPVDDGVRGLLTSRLEPKLQDSRTHLLPYQQIDAQALDTLLERTDLSLRVLEFTL